MTKSTSLFVRFCGIQHIQKTTKILLNTKRNALPIRELGNNNPRKVCGELVKSLLGFDPAWLTLNEDGFMWHDGTIDLIYSMVIYDETKPAIELIEWVGIDDLMNRRPLFSKDFEIVTRCLGLSDLDSGYTKYFEAVDNGLKKQRK